VRWFSYPEDKFYEGHFLLPQQRIHALLKEGYWNTRKSQHQTYHALTVCLLPRGAIVIWLSGQNQVLIGRYEGREIPFDFKQFNEAADRPLMIKQERAKLPAHVQEEIRTHTLSTRQWDEYLKTYPWKVEFSQPLKLYHHGIFYVNAEHTQYAQAKDETPYNEALLKPGARAIPQTLLLRVQDKYGLRREIFVDSFDEQEMLAAFRTLHAGRPAAPIVLYVDTDARVRHVKLRLQTERQQIELTKAKIALYDVK